MKKTREKNFAKNPGFCKNLRKKSRDLQRKKSREKIRENLRKNTTILHYKKGR